MTTAKDEVRKLLDKLPDDASCEDIQYHIYDVREKVQKGLADVEARRTLAQEEAEQRMSKWLAP